MIMIISLLVIIQNYDNMILNNCTNNENNIEIVRPLIKIIPCGMSLMCLISLMAYTLVKPFFNKNRLYVDINDG